MGLIKPGLSFSLIHQLKRDLGDLSHRIDRLIHAMDNPNSSLLNEFEEIHHLFHDIQVSTASHYLNSYLAPFTNQFEVLSKAIQHLSDRNYGALIVIQRKDALDSYIHSGVSINADLSFPLLESIFHTGSPLHDGAVLVCDTKIVSAANVLPVSKQKVVEKKLGTRHRAALGLSELTDALILVVSEETGRATFAFAGELYPIRTNGVT